MKRLVPKEVVAANLDRWLRWVSECKGTVVITENGKLVAEMGPIRQKRRIRGRIENYAHVRADG